MGVGLWVVAAPLARMGHRCNLEPQGVGLRAARALLSNDSLASQSWMRGGVQGSSSSLGNGYSELQPGKWSVGGKEAAA